MNFGGGYPALPQYGYAPVPQQQQQLPNPVAAESDLVNAALYGVGPEPTPLQREDFFPYLKRTLTPITTPYFTENSWRASSGLLLFMAIVWAFVEGPFIFCRYTDLCLSGLQSWNLHWVMSPFYISSGLFFLWAFFAHSWRGDAPNLDSKLKRTVYWYEVLFFFGVVLGAFLVTQGLQEWNVVLANPDTTSAVADNDWAMWLEVGFAFFLASAAFEIIFWALRLKGYQDYRIQRAEMNRVYFVARLREEQQRAAAAAAAKPKGPPPGAYVLPIQPPGQQYAGVGLEGVAAVLQPAN